jgi:methyl-accepting chemotaxis protein
MIRYTIKLRMGMRLSLVLAILVSTGLVGLYGIGQAMGNLDRFYAQGAQTLAGLARRSRDPALAAELVQRRQAVDALREQGATQLRQVSDRALGVVLVGVLLSVVFDGLFVGALTVRLRRALELARTVASGRLDNRIPVLYSDEIGELRAAFRSMDERLALVIRKVRDGAGAVHQAARRLAGDNGELSRQIRDDAAGLREVVQGINDVAASARRGADHAQLAADLTTQARQSAEQGGGVVEQTALAMHSIDAAGQRIAEILATIREISFQTHILALNAAVEAARAGEHGRGFAIVAAEVRQLASRSGEAASEIEQLIRDSQEKVAHGSVLAERSHRTLEQIIGRIGNLATVVGEIAAVSRHQAAAVATASSTLERLDAAVHEHERLLAQASAASEAMLVQADELTGEVSYFRFSDPDDAAQNGDVSGLLARTSAVHAPACG